MNAGSSKPLPEKANSSIAKPESSSQPKGSVPDGNQVTSPPGQVTPKPSQAAQSSDHKEQELMPVPKSHPLRALVWVGIVLIIIIAIAAIYLLLTAGREWTNDAYVDGRVVRISPRVSGQVMVLRVNDNDAVKAGDLLLEIDPADYQAKFDQASAAVLTTESAITQAQAAVIRAEAAIGEAEASVRAAQTEAKHRSSDYRRYAATGREGVSEQQLEVALTASETAKDQHEVAVKKLAAVKAELNVAQANVKSAESQHAAAVAQLEFAQLQLKYTKIIAPVSGLITKRNVEAGAFVSTGQPLMAIVQNEKWVLANFKEVQLRNMHAGQPVKVTVDKDPSLRLSGYVQSLQAGTGSWFQLLPPENATGNWVKVVQRLPVKIVFDVNQPDVSKLALGMSVEVTVDTRGVNNVSPINDTNSRQNPEAQ